MRRSAVAVVAAKLAKTNGVEVSGTKAANGSLCPVDQPFLKIMFFILIIFLLNR